MGSARVGHSRRRLTAGIVTLAVATIGLAPSAVGSSQGKRTTQAKPTVVLVHGGWADSSGWNSEVTALQRLGYPVIAPANPLRGLASDAAYVRSVLTTIDGPIVLVGHSYGGAVITNAAVGFPQVKALVYIAGFAPEKGESLMQLVTKNPGSEIGPATLIQRKYPLGGGGEGTDLYLTQRGFQTAFAGDVPKRQADQMWATQRPFSEEAFASLSGEPAWMTIPSWYLVATQDRAIPPVTHRFMAKRANAMVSEVKTSHVPMVSKPEATIKSDPCRHEGRRLNVRRWTAGRSNPAGRPPLRSTYRIGEGSCQDSPIASTRHSPMRSARPSGSSSSSRSSS